MSGTANLPKYLRCNREDQVVLKAAGIEFEQRLPVTVLGNIITGAQFLNDLLFTAASFNALGGPSAADLYTVMAAKGPVTLFSRFTSVVQNTDPVNPKVITFGPGITPASITIPPNFYGFMSLEVTGLNPPTFSVVALYPTAGGAGPAPGLPLTANPNDLLVWNGAAWVPTTAGNNTTGNLDTVVGRTIGNPIAPGVVAIDNFLEVNPNDVVWAYPTIIDATVPTYVTDNGNFGIRSQNLTQVNAQPGAGSGAGDSLLYTVYSNPAFTASGVVSTDTIFHIKCDSFEGGILTTEFAVDASGFVYSRGVNIPSDGAIKKNVEDLPFDSKKLEKVSGKRFQFKNQADSADRSVGVLAQDFDGLFPGVFQAPKGKIPATVNLVALQGLLLSALQDMSKRISALEAPKK